MTDEIERWKAIDRATISEMTDDEGVVNEMALLFKLRRSFPLHYRVFKQVSSHLCHEANTEQLFSLSGSLSDDNGKMSPDALATWTSIGSNMKIFKPTMETILQRYMHLYAGGTAASDAAARS